MCYQGRITHWKDDQGFGFITQNGDGRQVFIHIKSFSNRQRRPIGNEVVTYELKIDAKGRLQAANVVYAGERARPATSSRSRSFALILALAFLAFLAALAFAGRLPVLVLGLYLLASVIAFVAYALDKSAAKNDRWRIQESTLHLFALVGGWPGALAAQQLLRHKSKKKSFQYVFRATVALNSCALGWLFSSAGAESLRSILDAARILG